MPVADNRPQVEVVGVFKLSDLTPDPQNARRHTPRNIQLITSSLLAVGAGRSLVLDENRLVLAGNGVLEAAADAGIEDVILVRSNGRALIAHQRTDLTEEQKIRLAIADNLSSDAATGNVVAGFDAAVLVRLDASVPLQDLWTKDEWRAVEFAAGGVYGDDFSGVRSTNSMDRIDRGAGFTALRWGDIMTALPDELYQRVLQAVEAVGDQREGMVAILNAGLNDRDS